MSTIAVFSAKGAPGATTVAMALASLWPRPSVLVDCDPAGGDVAIRLPSTNGTAIDVGKGMLSLLPMARRSLEPDAVLEHAQPVLGGGLVIAGLNGPEQAAAGGQVWSTLAGAFRGLSSHDVVIDLGRLDSGSPVLPLARGADVVICTVGSGVTGVYAARARLRTLLPALEGAGSTGPVVGMVVQCKDERFAREAAGIITAELPSVRDLGRVAFDPDAARMFDGRPVKRPERTMLVRSVAEVIAVVNGYLPSRMATAMDVTEPAGVA